MAGTLKVNAVQLGDSATATQNFVLQTNVDGSGKLARGNIGATTQDILTFDSLGAMAGSGQGLNYLPAGTGAIRSLYFDKVSTFKTVEEFGAVGDGTTDDTTAIQNALTEAATQKVPLLFQGKTYIVNPINVPSNSVLKFNPNTVIKAKTGYVDGQRMLNIANVSNVTIYGNNGTCQMRKADYVSGEQRHGVFIISSSNVSIYNLRSIDTGGDGFYIGAAASGGTPSNNVLLQDCVADNNRRQGLSIVSCKDGWVIGGEYKNTTGTAPAAGIDIEPDANDIIQNVNLIGVKTSGNYGSGFLVVPYGSGISANSYFSVNLIGCESYNDVTVGGDTINASFRFDNGSAPLNQIGGTITVRDCRSNLSNTLGLTIGNNSWTNSPALRVDGLRVTNPGTNGTPGSYSAYGVSLYTTFSTSNLDNVVLRNVYCEDTRATKKMYGSFLIGGASFQVTNSTLIDCGGGAQLLNDGPYVFVGTVTNFLITNTNPSPAVFTGSGSIDQYSGLLISANVSATLTLPLAVGRVGCEYDIWNSDGTSTITIQPSGTDLIQQTGLVAGEQVILRSKGSRIKLKSIASGVWAVVMQYGAVAPQGFNDPKRVVYQTAAPVARAWLVGDRCINSTPTVGQPKAWTCTVAGTPGTWVSEGNL